jgi:hypothetical protein
MPGSPAFAIGGDSGLVAFLCKPRLVKVRNELMHLLVRTGCCAGKTIASTRHVGDAVMHAFTAKLFTELYTSRHQQLGMISSLHTHPNPSGSVAPPVQICRRAYRPGLACTVRLQIRHLVAASVPCQANASFLLCLHAPTSSRKYTKVTHILQRNRTTSILRACLWSICGSICRPAQLFSSSELVVHTSVSDDAATLAVCCATKHAAQTCNC